MSWVGIDLGGTKIYAVIFDGTDVLAEGKTKTPTQGGPLAVVDAMAAVVRDLGPVEDLAGVGVGAPGVIDPEEGTVQQAPNLPGWMEPFDVAGALSSALDGVPVVVDNDVNVGTLANIASAPGKEPTASSASLPERGSGPASSSTESFGEGPPERPARSAT